jgi:hypothetical protein
VDSGVVASIGSGDRPQSEEVERERAARLSAERRVREIDEQLQQARSTTAASGTPDALTLNPAVARQ